MPTQSPIGAFDFTDPGVQAVGIPHDRFAAARATAPVHWVEQPVAARSGFTGSGYWALTRHRDVLAVSRNSKDFSTWENGAIIRLREGAGRDEVEVQRLIPLNQDDPEHAQHRAIVSRTFTPRAVAHLDDDLTARGRAIVEEAMAAGSGNFVEQVAAELPLQAIASLLGVPLSDRDMLFSWTNQMMAYEDPDSTASQATGELFSYFMALADERTRRPGDDIVSRLVTPGPDGHSMSADQFGFFVTLIVVAGNETTRNAITHGMNALLDHPDQWELFRRERPGSAVDEILRWASPVTAFQRTAVRDVTIGDQAVRAGDRVGMFYSSANFDETVFTDPQRFDITRATNPHLAFGGHGAHYCIGANLARLEVSIMMNAIADLAPGITKLSEPRRIRHSWINGVDDLQVRYA